MRTVKVYLIQDRDEADTFYVSRFSNSSELSIGDKVPRSILDQWADRSTFPRVEFTVIGLAPETEEGSESEPENQLTRADALSLNDNENEPY